MNSDGPRAEVAQNQGATAFQIVPSQTEIEIFCPDEPFHAIAKGTRVGMSSLLAILERCFAGPDSLSFKRSDRETAGVGLTDKVIEGKYLRGTSKA